jgi:glycosyltransferase involved in cell wall biosynthesis
MNKELLIHFSDCFYPRINGVTTAISSIVYSLKDDFTNILIAPNYSDNKINKISIENYQDYLIILRIPSYIFIFNKEDRFMNFSNKIIQDIFDYIYNNFSSYNWTIFNHNILNSFFISNKFYKYFLKNKGKFNKYIKKVFYFHTFWEYYIHYVPLPDFLSKFILKILNRKVIKESDLVLVANDYVKNYILSNYFNKIDNNMESKVKVLPLPLNIIFWEDKNLEIDEILKNKKYIMYAGRLAKEKNLFFLIDIFKEISNLDNSFEFYICGDGPDKNKLINYVYQNNLQNKIYFTGYLSQELIRRYYKFSQAVLFVSKTETLGLVLLEAMAQKSLVIALNIDPFNKIIKNNYNGFLIDTEDPKDFASKVLQILNNNQLINSIKENSFNFSLNYHPQNFKQNFISILKDIPNNVN